MNMDDTLESSETEGVNTVRNVVSDFSETAKYLDILERVRLEVFQILYCHGFAGTGKSSIVQKLAQEFPYFDDARAVKYHIECDNQDKDMKRQLVKMLEIMKKHNHVNEIKENTVHAEMEKDKAETLVQILSKCESPILVIIEDIKSHNYVFLSSFFENLERMNCYSSKIHVYITGRQKKLPVPQCMEPRILSVEITGFTTEEGKRYLLNGGDNSADNLAAAGSVVKRFSAAPLGLKAAKEYCKVNGINYVQYMQYISEDSDYVSGREEGLIDRHIYQAITLPFTKKGKKNYVEQDWWIMTCLSFLYHYEIPYFVILSLCQSHHSYKKGRGMLHWKADDECKRLINELRLHHLCTERTDASGKCAAISCHQVVLDAFRFVSNKGSALEGAVYALASIATKDLREEDMERRINKLVPHLHSVLHHCQNLKLFEEATLNEEWMLNNLVLSDLYEVLGSIGLQHEQSEKCEKYLDIALNKILKIIQFLGDDVKPLCIKTMKLTDKNVSEINDTCSLAGRKLPDGFIARFESKVATFPTKGGRNILRSNSTNTEHFDGVCKDIDSRGGVLCPQHIETFRELGICLDEDTHRNVFFSERISMLLHSMSRLPVFKDGFNTFEAIERYKLDSDRAYRIAEACKPHSFLLVEYLTRTGGSISLLLKCKGSSVNEELLKAKKYSSQMIVNTPLMYEHGFIKECQDVKGKIQLLRLIVRINLRLLEDYNDEEMKESDQDCLELERLAKFNPEVGMAITCWVYCAKYFSKKKDFIKAYQLFDDFFQASEAQESKPRTIAWGTFNYARAVYNSRTTNRVADAITKCKQMLQDSVIRNPSLIDHLEEYLDKLGTLNIL